MTNHTMVYGISGDSYSDLNTLKAAGIIDYHLVVHGGGFTPPVQFPRDCAAAGVSPILNNGNDGVPGWDGTDYYYTKVASMGYMAAGGESEQAPEIDSIMTHLIFMDYGGQGTGGGTNDNIWFQTHPGNVSGHGAASYLETYDAATNVWGWDVIGPGAKNAKAHGVKEVGILVGNWMINHSNPQDYINLANAYEANGITCAGFVVWGGYGNNMNALYNQFAPWFKTWQAIWPPNMTTIDKRFGGSGPTPTPTPPATPVGFSGSLAIADDGSILITGSDKAVWRNFGGKWTSLGGAATSSPATTGANVFVRGTDGALWYRPIAEGGKWLPLGGAVLVGSTPAVHGSDIYVMGTDNAIYHRTLTANWLRIASKIR